MPRPSKEEIQKIFEAADKDKSGKLSVAEFKKAMIELSVDEDEKKQYQNEDVIQLMYESIGDDKEITLDLLEGIITQNDNFDGNKMMVRMIKRADRDGDGFIDAKEMVALAKIMSEDDDEAIEAAKQFFEWCGGKKSKKIRPQALLDFFELGDEDQKDPKEKAKTMFRMNDTNGDGYISKQELAEMMASIGGDVDEEAANDPVLNMMYKAMIAEHDKDEDGKLNYEEFCEWMEKNDNN